MAKNSAIEWTDHTWNPWVGCLKVSPGCKMCYMYREQNRYGNNPRVVRRTKDRTFFRPMHWREPALVFTCSWTDFFIEQADEWRDEAWDVIRSTPHLTYQVLTKRPEGILDRLPADWGDGYNNVWLGVSIENQEYLHRIHYLSLAPAKLYFVSYEPALDRVNFGPYMEDGMIDWLISGGESDYHNPRPAKLDWFRSVRDQCQEHGVAYFHKQHGGSKKIDGVWGGRLLDGREWNEFPEYHKES